MATVVLENGKESSRKNESRLQGLSKDSRSISTIRSRSRLVASRIFIRIDHTPAFNGLSELVAPPASAIVLWVDRPSDGRWLPAELVLVYNDFEHLIPQSVLEAFDSRGKLDSSLKIRRE